MRNIKFRGLKITGGHGWVYGYPIKWPNGQVFIAVPHRELGHILVEVYPETVGQYTGYRTIRDIGIYEGDIVARPNKLNIKIKRPNGSSYKLIKWSSTNNRFNIQSSGNYNLIGNKHEHPELLGIYKLDR